MPGDSLAALLAGTTPPGLYRWTPPTPAELAGLPGRAARAGRHAAVLDAAGVTGKAAFLARCAAALGLPAWFGHNWDALHDCLTDLSWWEAPRGRLIAVAGWPGLCRRDPGTAAGAAGVFEDAVAHWHGRPGPLTVLLTADPPAHEPRGEGEGGRGQDPGDPT
ncbi:hypothetical protein D7294_13900 [Streptomyces hoynatensis]|uniref:Barstar (barnase inhibitor) domain-containing protein n=1 Tax=Streptomyces hoynatensis TaxID=1141874 RepID=A0A3A9Z2R4_9ACTN|nr:hypothetical protein D7294_13900 [Streptomyces hoynatensis]